VSPGSPGPARRVLVVDDCPDNRASLCLLLRLWGHDCREAPDGPSALEQAADYRPDAVLLDLVMPGMDGYETARRLRRAPGLEALLLVAMTGYGRDEDVARTRQAGFDHHLVKPLDLGRLEDLLRNGGG
jgi:CheY-like chemotaxis protein